MKGSPVCEKAHFEICGKASFQREALELFPVTRGYVPTVTGTSYASFRYNFLSRDACTVPVLQCSVLGGSVLGYQGNPKI